MNGSGKVSQDGRQKRNKAEIIFDTFANPLKYIFFKSICFSLIYKGKIIKEK